MDASSLLGLAGFALAAFAAALSGGIFRPGTWYESLNKPSWRPPNWVFAPAWTVLYILIAVSGWMVWREAGFSGAGMALTIYGIQLLLNAGWSALFFGLKRMDWAFAEVVALWLSILATIIAFQPIEPLAALLLWPYLAWVSFAAFLNFTMWRLNPDAGRSHHPQAL